MKVMSPTIMNMIHKNFDTEENINKLLNKSQPISEYSFSVENIKESAGWVYITGKFNESEYSINYSSAIFDHAELLEFLADIIKLKDAVTIFLDYEGSYPMLYAKKVDKDTVRFMFAHDYILYENDDNDTADCLPLYKIECDILINKKELLEKFYDILNPFIKNHTMYGSDSYRYDFKGSKRYLKKIKKYLKGIKMGLVQ